MSNSGYCSLIVTGDNLDLDLIEETLNIASSEKWKKGEIFNSVVGKAQSDFISFNEKMKGKYNPDKTLTALLNRLMDNEVFLKDMSKKAHVYINCYVQSDYAQINYMLASETISKAAKLGVGIEISILSWGGVKDKKKRKRSE